jgi:hypothetical protein
MSIAEDVHGKEQHIAFVCLLERHLIYGIGVHTCLLTGKHLVIDKCDNVQYAGENDHLQRVMIVSTQCSYGCRPACHWTQDCVVLTILLN